MKKAVSLSLNTIIIAALALIVLIVLAVILSGRMGIFTGGVATCKKDTSFRCVKTKEACKAGVSLKKGDKRIGQAVIVPGENWKDCKPPNVCCKVLYYFNK